jgi:hypothetical protein
VTPAGARYAVPDDVLSRELEGEMVLLHTRSSTYFSLNRTGTRVWRLLAGSASLGEVGQSLAPELGVSPERLAADLEPFVRELVEAGLIVPRGEAAG